MASNRLYVDSQNKNPSRKTHGSRETSNAIRRSFTGNPFRKPSGSLEVSRGFDPVTPANSPSSFPRNLIDKRSKLIDRESEEKENGMDRFTEQSIVESPRPTKPTKHFMSPTISAVSKINASPRKKILADRNDLVRSSLNVFNEASDSHDPMVTVTDPSSLRSKDSFKKEVGFDSKVQMISPTDSDTSLGHTDNVDSHKVDVPRSPLASLDADPLLPPYDPDTNYLSPRPQFLHYRPTPKIKHFLGEETDRYYLNDSVDFVEGLSEAELMEETSSDDSLRETQNEISGEAAKEVKDDAEIIFDMEERAVDARDVSSSEKSELTSSAEDDWDDLVTTCNDEMEVEEEIPEAENPKANGSHFFTKSKCFAMIFVVLVAGMVMGGIHSSITSCSTSNGKEWRLCKIAEMGNYMKAKVDSWNYMSGFVYEPRDRSETGRSVYFNSSFVHVDSVFEKDRDSCLLLDRQNHELDLVESWMKHSAETEPLEDNELFEDTEAEGQAMDSDITEDVIPENDLSIEMPSWDEEEVAREEEAITDAVERDFQENFEEDSRDESIEDSPAIHRKDIPEKLEVESESESKAETADLKLGYSEVEPPVILVMAGISTLVLILTTYTGLVYLRTKRVTLASKEQQPWKLKKFDISHVSAAKTEEHHGLRKTKHASSSGPTVVDMAGESCPSEISSYQNTNSFTSVGPEQTSNRRHKKMAHRRESLVSSSSDYSAGSPSYGSFTTYEKIPLKHRNGEEEVVVTPIRRSSRLMKQFTSP